MPLDTVEIRKEDFNEEKLSLFWSKVDIKGPDECWDWKAGKFNSGYGAFSLNGKTLKAHRISATLTNGPIPSGMVAAHRCDRPCCINPSHIFIATPNENTQDAKNKGRTASGDRSASRKYPGLRLSGDDHPFRKNPSLAARGERNGAVLHPEKLKRGEENAAAKLTAEQVLEIRAKFATGKYYLKHLSAEYNIGLSTIARIVKRITWAHI